MRTLCAVGVLLLMACQTGGSSMKPGGAPTVTMEQNVDRMGGDYKDWDMERAEPTLCQEACAADAQCAAYTYVKPGVQGPSARCWLKNVKPDPSEADCCVSGVKQ